MRAAPARTSDRAEAVTLSAILLFSALAFGSVHGWSVAIVEAALGGLAAWWAARAARGSIPRGIAGAAAALLLYLLFQTLPLPPSLAAALSPGAAAIRDRAAQALATTDRGFPAIGPVAELEDERAPVAAREKIRELADREPSLLPARWRPLSLYPYATRAAALELVALAIAFWIAATTAGPAKLLRAVIAIGASLAFLALVEFATWNGHVLWTFVPYDAAGPLVDYPRMVGSFVNPDHFASLLAMCLPPAAALLVEARRGRRALGVLATILLALGSALMVAALIGTASRAAIGGALAAVALALWKGLRPASREEARAFRNARPPRNRLERAQRTFRTIAAPALGCAILFGGILYAGAESRATLGERVADLVISPEQIGFRLSMAAQTRPMVRDFPLFGVGAGCWREVFRRYEHYPVVGLRPNHAHDDYVEWAAEVGAIGVLLTLALAWQIVRFARSNDGIPRALRWGLLGAVVAIALQETLDFGLRAPANALLLAVLAGLLCNRGWRHAVEGAAGERRHGARLGAAVIGAAAFAWLGLGELREFLEWSAVRAGSAQISFAPRNAETWYELGALLHREGFRYLPPTAESLRAAIRRRPAWAAPYRLLARGAERSADKLVFIERALDLDPTRAEWRLEQARLLEQVGRRDEALAAIEEAAYRDPRLASHPYLTASNQRLGEPLLARVGSGLRRALAEHPDDAFLLDQVATFDHRFSRWRDAAELWSRAAALTGEWSLYGPRAGESYARADDPERAEECLRRALDDDPSKPEAYRVLALSVYAPRRRFDDAEKILELGARRSADPASLYLSLSQIETEKGDAKAAIAALEKAADLRQKDPAIAARLGAAYLQAEDYHRAKIALDRAIALAPGNASFYYLRGVAAERRYDLREALESYERAASLEARNATYSAAVARLRNDFGASR